MDLEIFLPNKNKTIELGKFIGKKISSPLVVYFFGDLGTGKTYFSKGIAKGLGLKDDIISPTFTLINHYNLKYFDLYHLDLYRLNSLNEILDLGIEDFIDNKSIILIEWAEKLNGYKFNNDFINIHLSYFKNARKCIISSEESKFENLFMEIKDFVSTWN